MSNPKRPKRVASGVPLPTIRQKARLRERLPLEGIKLASMLGVNDLAGFKTIRPTASGSIPTPGGVSRHSSDMSFSDP